MYGGVVGPGEVTSSGVWVSVGCLLGEGVKRFLCLYLRLAREGCRLWRERTLATERGVAGR